MWRSDLSHKVLPSRVERSPNMTTTSAVRVGHPTGAWVSSLRMPLGLEPHILPRPATSEFQRSNNPANFFVRKKPEEEEEENAPAAEDARPWRRSGSDKLATATKEEEHTKKAQASADAIPFGHPGGPAIPEWGEFQWGEFGEPEAEAEPGAEAEAEAEAEAGAEAEPEAEPEALTGGEQQARMRDDMMVARVLSWL